MANAAQAAPTEMGEGGGPDIIKKAAAGIMQQADILRQAAMVLKDSGAPGQSADKIGQAAELIESAMADMGLMSGEDKMMKGGVNPKPVMMGGVESMGNKGVRPVGVEG
jgi:hypothetical protein